ncbi:hypothetical protein SAY86_003322 [Trapa natans]|uniref:VQ domain-containing protein n=1 Tax=Trapa natans TaxID=22666 RepID=A0AAN7MCI7_TRANT|nr:hypothetical protein SAY86_003322 [Trapa natans]
MASRSVESSSSGEELSVVGNRDDYSLKHIHTNKLSHKISKTLNRKPAVPGNLDPQLLPDLARPFTGGGAAAIEYQNAPPQLPQQPPVYNISKSDFRDVVQRLTGATPPTLPPQDPPAQPPTAALAQSPRPPPSISSRLHRIRPPPLAQLTARPPPIIQSIVDPIISAAGSNPVGRQGPPLSPLPPLPGVHLAAESPVSAYMRRLRSSPFVDPNPSNQMSCLSPLAPPPLRWPAEQVILIPPEAAITSPYRLIPPVPLFPPTSPSQPTGFPFPQLPLSPTVPSPKP